MTHLERAREWLTALRADAPRLNWFASERETANAVSLLAPSLAALLAEHDEKVRAEEREACARVAVKALRVRERMSSQDDGFGSSEAMVAAAIRARATKGETT